MFCFSTPPLLPRGSQKLEQHKVKAYFVALRYRLRYDSVLNLFLPYRGCTHIHSDQDATRKHPVLERRLQNTARPLCNFLTHTVHGVPQQLRYATLSVAPLLGRMLFDSEKAKESIHLDVFFRSLSYPSATSPSLLPVAGLKREISAPLLQHKTVKLHLEALS